MPNSATMTTAPSALRAALERAAQQQLLAKARRAGEEGVREIAAEAAATYPTRRPESRRRGAASIVDESNYGFEAVPTGSAGVKLDFFVANSDNRFRVKFFTLNNGSRGGYPIVPTWPRKTLAYNKDNPASETPNHFPPSVIHPGVKGSHFYERSIQRVMARLRR